jgi:hypothetical protein
MGTRENFSQNPFLNNNNNNNNNKRKKNRPISQSVSLTKKPSQTPLQGRENLSSYGVDF